jgi:hypothetical protein
MNRILLGISAAAFGAVVLPTSLAALPTCVELGTNPAWGVAGNALLSAASTTLVPASGSNAAYCQVNITVASQSGPGAGYLPGQSESIRVRVGLPLSAADGGSGGVQGAWNGKQQNTGGGGYAGSVGNVTGATNTGYVGTSTDTGHSGGSGAFALNPDNTLNFGLIKDFSLDGVRAQSQWGKVIAKTYYGTATQRNYWTGCSTGGRQGHILAQKYPNEFDGILAGAPAFNWDRFIPSELWPQVVMNEELGAPISGAKLSAVSAAAIAACDGMDGVVDGIMEEPRKCSYNANSFVCSGSPGDPANCLTAAEASAVNKIWDGPRNAKGQKVWFGLERGASLSGLAGTNPFSIATDHFRYWIKQDPAFDWHTVTKASFVDDFVTSELKFQDVIGSDQPDLTKFRNAGAKMIMYYGLHDSLIFPRGAYNYYNRVASIMGGISAIQQFYRFFPYPNNGHCGGGAGPAINNTDLFGALVNWVENGLAPDFIVASQNLGGGAMRSRKICKYPDVQIYDGTGSTDDQANFECQLRTADDPALLAADQIAKRFNANQ